MSLPARKGFSAMSLILLVGALAAGGGAEPPAPGDTAKSLKKKISTAIRKQDWDAVNGHAHNLASLGGSEAASTLFEIGLRLKAPAVYKEITKLLSTMTDDGAFEFFEKEAGVKQPERLIYLGDILSAMKRPRAAKIVGRLVESKSSHVRRAAIVGLAKLRLRESVPPLLALVETLEKARNRGLLYQEARDALYDITGFDFHTYKDWNKWWEPVKDSFDPEAKAEGATRVVRKPREGAPEFVGHKIFSKNVLFILDNSGTMQYVMKDDIPGLATADGSDAGGIVKQPEEEATPEDKILAKFWTRMEMAKRELAKALSAFGRKTRVNVASFNTTVRLFEKKLKLVSPKYKKTTLLRVKKLNWVSTGGTDTLGALKKAFTFDQRVTAIYFLSDGLPSADGKTNDNPMPILDEIDSLNRFRKVRIHTFGYDPVSRRTGQPGAELTRANEFLQKLAKRTGGTFTLLKVTNEKPPKGYKNAAVSP